jgi:hypothetical protein
VADDTDQTWYVYDDQGEFDAAVAPETERNIPPADAALTNFHTNNSQYPTTHFSF